MNTTPTHPRRLRLRFTLPLIAVALVAAACGDDDDPAADEGPESAYCDNARAFAVYVLDGTGDDQPTPAAARAYWAEYQGFFDRALGLSPESLRPQHVLSSDAIATTLKPLLEKYDYDVERIAAEGTPEEQTILDEPPADIQAAQTDILAYESRVCGTAPGEAADVTFQGDEPSDEFCAAAAEFDEGFAAVIESKFDPAVLRGFIEAPEYTGGLDRQVATAPAEVADDVVALTEWYRTRAPEVLAAFDYDVRKLILDGTPQDRAAFQQTDPAIAEQHGRVLAYEEQICGS